VAEKPTTPYLMGRPSSRRFLMKIWGTNKRRGALKEKRISRRGGSLLNRKV